jgi:DNA-binding NarL/FixJ family response regulator
MNIAIIENNNFYRESLKTALNQIVDFKVSFDSDDLNSFFQITDNSDFQIILLDF